MHRLAALWSPRILLPALCSASLLCGCSRGPRTAEAPGARHLRDLVSTTPETRMAAAAQLGLMREKAAVRPLSLCLGDVRSDVRLAAAEALGRIGDPAAVPPLCALLADPSAGLDLRKQAADALGAIGDASAVPHLERALHVPEEDLVFAAAYALGRIGEPALAALTAALDCAEPAARRAAATAIGSIAGDKSAAAMRRFLDDPDPIMRLSAAENLARLNDTSSVARVTALLLDPSDTVRFGMPRVLAKFGIAAAPALCAILDERAETVTRAGEGGKPVRIAVAPARHEAVKLLLSLNGPAVVRPLLLAQAAARGEDANDVREHLVRQQADPRGRAEMMRLCGEGSPEERTLAVTLLSAYMQSLLAGNPNARNPKEALSKAGIADVAQVVETFARAAADASPRVKLRGALALCVLGDRRGRDPVLAELRRAVGTSPDGAVEERSNGGGKQVRARQGADLASAKACLDALVRVADKPLADEMVSLLKMGSAGDAEWQYVLARAIRVIGQVADPAHADALLPLINGAPGHDGNSMVVRAWCALGAMHDKRAYDPILRHLQSIPNDNFCAATRLAGYRALCGADPDRAYDYIGRMLLTQKPHVVALIDGIAAVFGDYPDRRAVLPLVHWINHDIDITQRAIRKALAAQGEKDIGWLIEGFEVEGHAKRSSLAGLIADAFGARALPHALTAAQDKRPRVRQGAVWTLGCLGGADAAAAVRAALKDGETGVRAAAVWSAGRLADPAFVEQIVSLLSDREQTVRSMAAEQLAAFKDARAVPALIAALKDADPQVRGYAAVSLGKLRAAEAKPGLEALLKDPDGDVRAGAEFALNAIARAAGQQAAGGPPRGSPAPK